MLCLLTWHQWTPEAGANVEPTTEDKELIEKRTNLEAAIESLEKIPGNEDTVKALKDDLKKLQKAVIRIREEIIVGQVWRSAAKDIPEGRYCHRSCESDTRCDDRSSGMR